MLIVIAIYAALIWLVFFKFKWLPFSWTFGSFAAVIGLGIVLVFMGLLSFLTPTGKIEVIGKVAEIAPNVSGQVVDIPVRHNVVVKSGDVLFQIDQAPYQYKVRQLKAALAEAQQKVSQLKANVEAATADVEAVRAQFERANQRRMDTERLVHSQTSSQFSLQDITAQASALGAQLESAEAKQTSARLASTSDIDGQNTTVAQLQAQLDNSQWELEQTTVRAPADGYVSAATLTLGTRVSPSKAAMGFIVFNEIEILGIFPQNGFQTIRPGTAVRLVFSNSPGQIHETRVLDVLRGVGEGQFAASGDLPNVNSVGLTSNYAARLETPKDIDPRTLKLGMSGVATAFSDKAGPIGVIASLLLFVKAYALYI